MSAGERNTVHDTCLRHEKSKKSIQKQKFYQSIAKEKRKTNWRVGRAQQLVGGGSKADSFQGWTILVDMVAGVSL